MRSLSDQLDAELPDDVPAVDAPGALTAQELQLLAEDPTLPLSRPQWWEGIARSHALYLKNRTARKAVPVTCDGGFYTR